jgi:hypothetical protein
VDPTTYEWTGDREKDGEIIERLRKRYNWEKPKGGTEMYGGYFGGINGTAPGLGYRNDNPIDYSTEGAGFVSQGIDPNDPALGYYIANFKKKEAENWAWANGEYWANNKRTGNSLTDDAAVLDWYWRDLARRMDKSNSFFDSFLGKLFVNIAVGWATAGIGNMFGPWAASLFGGITSGAMNDWDPLSMIMGAVTPQLGNIMDSTGLSGLANDILPDWASLRLPETTQMVTGIDKFGNAVIRDVFDYTLNDALQSAGMTTAKEALSRFQESLSQEQGQGGAEPASLQPGAAPGLTPLPQGYVPPPITPVDPVRFGQGASQPPTNPFDAENNPFNPVTEYAKGGTVRRSIEDMTDNEFIGMRRDDMPGAARRDLGALMARSSQGVPQYANGGMISQNAAGLFDGTSGSLISNNASTLAAGIPTTTAGGVVSQNKAGLASRPPKKPAYLGAPVQGMPGFYQINPNKFDFYKMAAQMDQPGVYTVGAPKLSMYETPEGSGYGVRARPGGQYVSRMPSDNTSAWNTFLGNYNVSPYAPYHGTTTASFEGAIPRTDLRKPALPKDEYNAAMRQLYADLAAEGKPMIAYYDPAYSVRGISSNAGGLMASQRTT